MTTATFVVVGGGIAGVSCAEALKFLCPKETIVLITQSSLIKAVTNLVPLGKALTRFDVEERNVETLKDQIEIIVDSLVSINSTKRIVVTKSGLQVHYKYLCICTGGDPKLIDSQNEFVIGIRDTESIAEFQNRIKQSKRILLVGNGGIASEIAFEASNIEIDWIVKDNFITSTFVDPGAAEFFQKKLNTKTIESGSKPLKRIRYSDVNLSEFKNEKGAALGPDWHRKIDLKGSLNNGSDHIRIHYETEIAKIQKNEETQETCPLRVTLTNGKELLCDFIVSATGVNPSINFKCDKEFLLGPDGGICVDEFQRTNLEYIFAAGDVCFANWNLSEDWFQMRLWTQARQMGAMAGKAMAAALTKEEITQDFCFELFGHVTKLFGFQVVLLGRYNGQNLGTNYEALLRITPDKEYIKLVLQNGKLKGAILIGDTGLEETCENLILNQLDLSMFKEDLLDPNIDIEDYFD